MKDITLTQNRVIRICIQNTPVWKIPQNNIPPMSDNKYTLYYQTHCNILLHIAYIYIYPF